MNKSRLVKLLWALCLIISVDGLTDTNGTFTLPSGVQVEIVESIFQRNLFNVSECRVHEEVCIINGRIPFGVDVGFPKTFVKSIRITYQGQSYSLDVSDMYNAWGARPLEYKGKIRYFGGKCTDVKNCQFRGIFSDAAGSFVAEWRILNGLSIRTILTSSNDVIKLFTTHVDPPEFD